MVLSLAVIATVSPAQAQQREQTAFQVEQFEPLPAQGTNTLNIANSDLLPHLRPSVGLFFHYVDDPLQVTGRDDDDVIRARLIDSQAKLELSAAVGLFDYVQLGFVLPFVMAQNGDNLAFLDRPADQLEGAALADLRLIPKFRFIDPSWAAGFGAALQVPVYVPIGDQSSFNSDGVVRAEPRLVLDWRHDTLPLVVAGNIGVQFRPETRTDGFVSDDTLRWGLAAQLPSGAEMLQVIVNLFGSAQLVDQVDLEGFPIEDARTNPLEIQGALRFRLPYSLVADVGAGAGLTRGVGAPDFRFFASIAYTPTAVDTDGDGIIDRRDGCPERAEDVDDFEDSDGCPDTDNDGDGLLDDRDRCPNRPEDVDQFKDEDGCPDPDNDADGIPDDKDECPMDAGPEENKGCPIGDRDGDGVKDDVDKCPDEPGVPERGGCPIGDRDGDGILDDDDRCPEDPEDEDGFEDDDGCPDKDNDEDGILDINDSCKNEKEDIDGFEDEDGCPDPDNDGDGIKDEQDKCPDKKETVNGVKDEDGCPDKGKSKVKITRTKIEILEKVYFETNKAKIQQRSFNLLSQVASILKANPKITKVRIEGHTDARGSADYNLELSERRAESVQEYLIGKGVSADRLVAKGYGETKPVEEDCKDKASSKERKRCWSKNRRVEFTILEVEGKPVGEEGAVIEKKEVVE
jgi:outer membrane protein OmpA-like peptidoglycan-associated protein